MTQRIRYKKLPNGLHESIRTFTSKQGHKYKVYLDLDSMNYNIKNMKRQEMILGKSKNITNKNVLKRTAKAHLKELGVELGEVEMRDRTFGRCQKGHTEDKEREK
jgi:hypothetical protein